VTAEERKVPSLIIVFILKEAGSLQLLFSFLFENNLFPRYFIEEKGTLTKSSWSEAECRFFRNSKNYNRSKKKKSKIVKFS
jgi:hypothetical protein